MKKQIAASEDQKESLEDVDSDDDSDENFGPIGDAEMIKQQTLLSKQKTRI